MGVLQDKKLRRYVLYVAVPSVIVGLILSLVGYYEMTPIDPLESMNLEPEPTLPSHMTPIKPQVGKFDVIPYNAISILTLVGFTVFAVYLVVKWSRE